MMQDYSKRYSPLVGGKQKVGGRDIGTTDGGGRLWKASGMIISIAMVLGVVASFWFGWLINNGLNELSRSEETRVELTNINNNLMAKRDQLLVSERIEEKGKKIGLYPPTSSQQRRP